MLGWPEVAAGGCSLAPGCACLATAPGEWVLPDTENSDVGGVHDADGEPGISGGVVGACRATWVRCRCEGVLGELIAVSGQAGAGNGAVGSAGPRHG